MYEEDNDETEHDMLRSKRRETAAQLLPRAMLENAVGLQGLREIAADESCCLVVEAPSADWAKPIYQYLKSLADWDHYVLRLQPTRSRTGADDDDGTERVLNALAEGGRVLGVSHRPSTLLPKVLISTADRRIGLPPVNGKIVGAVIAAVTNTAKGPVPDELCLGLSFDEIASSIRQGSTREQCMERLSRAREAKRDHDPAVASVPLLEDLHGYGEAREWALDLVADLESWRRGETSLAAIDKNVVLASAPGLGKSTFIRSVARSAQVPLIATSVGAWFSNSAGYLDSIIKQIDQLFQSAKAQAPAIIFLDELDGIPSKNSLHGKNSDWWVPVINHFLITLDGALNQDTNDIIVVGATNYVEKLDPALLRHGRLGRVIVIDPPGPEALVGIFRQHLGSDLGGVDLAPVASVADGASGATVVAWVKAARRTARVADRPMVLDDLLSAVAPPETRSEALRRRIAVHEAGHAAVAHVLGNGEVRAVSIIPSQGVGGSVMVTPSERTGTLEEMERLVLQDLAGRAAEEVVLGSVSAGAGGNAQSDLANATRRIGLLHLSAGLGEEIIYRADVDEIPGALVRHPRVALAVEKDLRRLYGAAMELVTSHRDLVEAITGELLTERHIGRERFAEIAGPVPGKDGNHG